MSHRERPAPRGSPVSGSVVGPPVLARLLAGDGFADLPPLDASEPTLDVPTDLDDRHRAAATLALRTPDVALVRISSPADHAVVVTAITDAAGRRGERLLVIDKNEHDHRGDTA